MSFFLDDKTLKSLHDDDLQVCEQKLLEYYKKKLTYYSPLENEEKEIQLADVVSQNKLYKTGNVFLDAEQKNSYVFVDKYSLKEGQETMYAFPISGSNQLWFSFMDPMIDINENSDITRNYKSIQTGDRLYIWVTLNKEGQGQHLSAVVVTQDNKHLSFGMGYDFTELGSVGIQEKYFSMQPIFEALSYGLSGKVYEARLFTSDEIIEGQLLRQLTREDFKGLKLVASATLTPSYVAYINEQFDQIKYEHVSFNLRANIVPVKVFDHWPTKSIIQHISLRIEKNLKSLLKKMDVLVSPVKDETLPELMGLYRNFNDQTMMLFNYLNLTANGYTPLLYTSYTVKVPETSGVYCLYSGKRTGRASNCTSFLQKIFGDLLNCGWFDNMFLNSDIVVSNPAWCRQNYDVAPVPDCRKTIRREVVAQKVQREKRGSDSDVERQKQSRKLSFQFNDKDIWYDYVMSLSPKRLAKLILSNKKYTKRFQKFLAQMEKEKI